MNWCDTAAAALARPARKAGRACAGKRLTPPRARARQVDVRPVLFLLLVLPIAANASSATPGQPSVDPQATTLTVTLTASPQGAADELDRILQDVEVIVYLRRWDQPREEARFKAFPSDGPRKVTFGDVARDQRHLVAVQVKGWVIPVEVLVKEGEPEIDLPIHFSEFSVEAQPDFALYASKSREQVAPALAAKSDPQTYVGRSGDEPEDSRSGYVLRADAESGQVEFVYWPAVRLFFAVLEVAESETDKRTKAFSFRVRRPEDTTVLKDKQRKCFAPGSSGEDDGEGEGEDCFSKVILRTIKVPQQRREGE